MSGGDLLLIRRVRPEVVGRACLDELRRIDDVERNQARPRRDSKQVVRWREQGDHEQ